MAKKNLKLIFLLILLSLFVGAYVKTKETPTKAVRHQQADYYIYTGILNLHEFDEQYTSTTPKILLLNNEGDILAEHTVTSSPFCVYPRSNLSYSYTLFNQNDPLWGGSVIISDGEGLERKVRVLDNPHTDIHCPHEVRPGTYLLPSYKLHTTLDGTLVQSFFVEEQDMAGNIGFTWDSLDHIDISLKDDVENRTYWLEEGVNDYFHGNDISLANDGNYLISGRNTNQVLKVNQNTGEVIWKLGGKDSDFTFTSDPLKGFSHQHSVSQLKNGNILLYDNGNQHSPPITRVVEYKLDEIKKTADLIWAYTDERFTYAAGSVQRLKNGNTLIGWGIEYTHPSTTARIVEISPSGDEIRAFYFDDNEAIYGAYARENTDQSLMPSTF